MIKGREKKITLVIIGNYNNNVEMCDTATTHITTRNFRTADDARECAVSGSMTEV